MLTIRSVKVLARVAAVVLALPLAACDGVLEVVDPDTVNPGTLDDPNFIDVVVAGAIGDFAVAYSGPGLTDTYLASVAAITDEFFNSETFPTRTATDRRQQFSPANGNSADAAYVNLHRARRATMLAAARVATHPDRGTSHPDYAELQALQGYTYLALGEGFCSSVPISNDAASEPTDGPPRTSRQLFEEAQPLFDAAGGTPLANIGKARALMNLGQYAAAAALVTSVPTTFNYFIEHSTTTGRQTNPFWSLQSNGRWSLSHNEGGNLTGLAFRGADPNNNAGQDPRIPWFQDPDGGFDPVFPLYVQLKYPYQDSDVPLASGIEARLIEAEAALASGGNWLAILNALRDSVGVLMAAQIDDYATWVPAPVLAPLVDPGTAATRIDLLFEERAFWLWGTGQRLGDVRRLINQYGRLADDVFPSGTYHKGGTYGTDVVFPVDFDEVNNTLYDISTCVVTSASID
jgi:hypothetical protein